MKTNDNPDYGNSFDTATKHINRNFAPETFWGTDRTFDKSDTRMTTFVHEYRISPDSQLRFADYERSYWARTPSATQAPNAQALVLNGATANGGPTRVGT